MSTPRTDEEIFSGLRQLAIPVPVQPISPKAQETSQPTSNMHQHPTSPSLASEDKGKYQSWQQALSRVSA
jgi:hypothetical protein